MLHLDHTKAFLSSALAEGLVADYALAVGVAGQRELLFSPAVNEESCFEVASLTKVLVTAPLVLQAVSKRLFTLDTPLSAFFDALPVKAQGITIHQLLTHTSGLGDIAVRGELGAKGSEAVLRAICDAKEAFAPGEGLVYSCMGFLALGAVLEKVYDKPLDALFEELLKKPLGLKRSRFCMPADDTNTPITYRRKERGDFGADDENAVAMLGVAGNAGAFFSIADGCKWVEALLAKSSSFYDEALFEEAERCHTPLFEEKRGLGWLLPDKDAELTGGLFPDGSFGHLGYTGCSLFVHRPSGLYVLLLSNAARQAYAVNPTHEFVRGQALKLRQGVHSAIKADLG